MKRIILALALFPLLAVITVALDTHVALAKTTKLQQQILPLNCVYQIVNDGSGTLIYLTPAECGQPISTPSEPGSGQAPTLPSNVTVLQTSSGVIQIPYVNTAGGTSVLSDETRLQSIAENAQYLPYAPLATVQSGGSTTEVGATTQALSSIPAPVIVIGATTALLLIVLLFI